MNIMKVHRFIAPNVRLAMQQVKDALGDDAIILSNNKKNGQIELTATTEQVLSNNQVAQFSQFVQPVLKKKEDLDDVSPIQINVLEELSYEINCLKKIITHNMSSMAWKEFSYKHPLAINFFHQLFSLGFSSSIVKKLIITLDDKWSIDTCIQNMSKTLKKWVVVNPELINEGGVFAFFGPSGTGKTHSVIKLGAHFRLKHPNKKIIFIYLDTAKTSGDKTLTKYAKILNAQFVFCDSENSLSETLKHIPAESFVLIDTANTNTPKTLENIKKENKKNSIEIKFILTFPLTHQFNLLNQYFVLYKNILPSSLLLTKLDEATQLAPGLSFALEKNIPICFYSKGIGIPEDIQPANMNELLRLSGLGHIKKTEVTQIPAVDEMDTWKIISNFK